MSFIFFRLKRKIGRVSHILSGSQQDSQVEKEEEEERSKAQHIFLGEVEREQTRTEEN